MAVTLLFQDIVVNEDRRVAWDFAESSTPTGDPAEPRPRRRFLLVLRLPVSISAHERRTARLRPGVPSARRRPGDLVPGTTDPCDDWTE